MGWFSRIFRTDFHTEFVLESMQYYCYVNSCVEDLLQKFLRLIHLNGACRNLCACSKNNPIYRYRYMGLMWVTEIIATSVPYVSIPF